MYRKRFLGGLLCGVSLVVAQAQAAEVKMSGLMFTHYEYVLSEHLKDGTPASDQNAFDVGRVYLNADAKFSDTVRGFTQYEVNLITRDATANTVFLKQALFEVKDVYPDAKIMFGLIPSSWRGYEEGIWKHRFVSKILDDIEGLFSSTDRGARLNGKAPFVEYDLAVINGEGTKANETKASKYKDLAGKVAVSPFKEGPLSGLKVNAYVQDGAFGHDLPRDRRIGGLSYASKRFNVMGTSYNSKDRKDAASAEEKGRGYSFHGVYNFSDVCWAFGRYDRWDPNKDKNDDARSRLFLGMGYKLADGVRLSLSYQGLVQEVETPTRKDERVIGSYAELKF